MNITERLIVAADFSPLKCGDGANAYGKVTQLARELKDTGLVIKVNSVLRAQGYYLIHDLHELGVRVMADLKLNDIGNTMKTDAEFLNETKPAIVTVMASSGAKGIAAFRKALDPAIEIWGVTVLTTFDDEECKKVYYRDVDATVMQFAAIAKDGGVQGIVCATKEIQMVRILAPELSTNIPAIRPVWSVVGGDDQKRVATPAQAIEAGAARIIVGRPIVEASENADGNPQNPREAVDRTLREIEEALKG